MKSLDFDYIPSAEVSRNQCEHQVTAVNVIIPPH